MSSGRNAILIAVVQTAAVKTGAEDDCVDPSLPLGAKKAEPFPALLSLMLL